MKKRVFVVCMFISGLIQSMVLPNRSAESALQDVAESHSLNIARAQSTHSFVASEEVARKMLNEFPCELVRKIFNNYIQTCNQGNLPHPLAPRFVTLRGEPGIGKTTIGYAVAKLIPTSRIVEVTGRAFLDTYKNSCAGKIHTFFGQFKHNTIPAIIIIDEFDKTIHKTHQKDFHDTDFLSEFMKALDSLPQHVLVIMTANSDFNFESHEAFAESRLRATCYTLGKASNEQRKLAIAQKLAQLEVSDQSTIDSVTKAAHDLSLREIDQLFSAVYIASLNESVTIDLIKHHIRLIRGTRTTSYSKWLSAFKDNTQLHYFMAQTVLGFVTTYINYHSNRQLQHQLLAAQQRHTQEMNTDQQNFSSAMNDANNSNATWNGAFQVVIGAALTSIFSKLLGLG